jgi:hypothetical protein
LPRAQEIRQSYSVKNKNRPLPWLMPHDQRSV